jgi:hypothetical protein
MADEEIEHIWHLDFVAIVKISSIIVRGRSRLVLLRQVYPAEALANHPGSIL